MRRLNFRSRNIKSSLEEAQKVVHCLKKRFLPGLVGISPFIVSNIADPNMFGSCTGPITQSVSKKSNSGLEPPPECGIDLTDSATCTRPVGSSFTVAG